MVSLDSGANIYTLTDERHHITYTTEVGGPLRQGEENRGGSLTYVGPEGTLTFTGQEINLQETDLPGTLLTIRLAPKDPALIGDVGETTFTIIFPALRAFEPGKTLTFHTLGIKASTIGNIAKAGATSTYQSFHLCAEAYNVILPLTNVK